MSGEPTNTHAAGLPSAPVHRAARMAAGVGLACHAGVLLAGSTATITADAATWFGVRGPHCLLGACLGELACPGCGLVRSTVASLHGDIPLALHFHPAGPVVALLAIAGLLLHSDILRRGFRTDIHTRLVRLGRTCFVISVLTGWLLRWTTAV